MSDRERCEALYDDDGHLLAVARVGPDITDESRAALRHLIEAAKRAHAEEVAADPSLAQRAEASRRRIAERNRWLRGEAG
jgi:hypothetical protein